MGQALRSWGWGKKVVVFQFLKNKKFPSGEVKAIENLNSSFKIIRFEQAHPLFRKNIDREKLKKEISSSLKRIKRIMQEEKFDLIILDEILNLIEGGFVSEKKIFNLLKHKPSSTELILTGRSLAPNLAKFSDYISEIREVKHPFQKGIRARKGIEF